MRSARRKRRCALVSSRSQAVLHSALVEVCVLLLCGRASAAETATITYKDRFLIKTEKGEIVSKTLKEVVFVKAAAEGEQKKRLVIKWEDVRSVNGEPAAVVLARVRKQYEDRLCRGCKGGTMRKRCARCAGRGKLVEKTMPCRRCEATGQGACHARGCKKGHVQCPGPCIKWGVGRWEHVPGLGMCRIFEYTDRRGRRCKEGASRAHIGEVVKVKNGQLQRLGPCKVCGGKSRVPCKVCDGSGKAECRTCRGTKQEPDPEFTKPCPDCVKGVLVCKECGGTGLVGKGEGVPPAAEAPPASEKGRKERDPNAIYLKDGREIRGKIMVRSGDTIVVKTESGKMISIKTADIESMP